MPRKPGLMRIVHCAGSTCPIALGAMMATIRRLANMFSEVTKIRMNSFAALLDL